MLCPAFPPADASCTGLTAVIVEPNFRDCFCVAHPTPRFAAVLDGTPSVLVASKVGAAQLGVATTPASQPVNLAS